MEIRQQILDILSKEDEDVDSSVILLDFIEKKGWELELPKLFEILLDSTLKSYWPQIIITLWYALGRKYPLPTDNTVAILHYCLERSDEVDGNLIWSITRNLKKVAYDSDYDPYQDETVWKIMQQFRNE